MYCHSWKWTEILHKTQRTTPFVSWRACLKQTFYLVHASLAMFPFVFPFYWILMAFRNCRGHAGFEAWRVPETKDTFSNSLRDLVYVREDIELRIWKTGCSVWYSKLKWKPVNMFSLNKQVAIFKLGSICSVATRKNIWNELKKRFQFIVHVQSASDNWQLHKFPLALFGHYSYPPKWWVVKVIIITYVAKFRQLGSPIWRSRTRYFWCPDHLFESLCIQSFGMGTRAKRFFQQHTSHLEITNNYYIFFSKTQKNSLHEEVTRRKPLGMDTAAATMAVRTKENFPLPSLLGRTSIARIIRGGPSVTPPDGRIAMKTREKIGVHDRLESQLYDCICH